MSNAIWREMTEYMKIGDRVVRGKDWIWTDDHDGSGPGTITCVFVDGSLNVKWDKNGFYQREFHYHRNMVKFMNSVDSTPPQKSLGSMIFAAEEFFDMKVICNDKTFQCHKVVLASQSDVFSTMFLNMEMNEAKLGEVKIDDFKAETIETLMYYFYNQKVEDVNLINTDLLLVAEKYNISGLLKICSGHLQRILSPENALDVLLTAHLTNQEDLFNAASKFVYKYKGKLAKTTAWIEMKETNPVMINNILSFVLDV